MPEYLAPGVYIEEFVPTGELISFTPVRHVGRQPDQVRSQWTYSPAVVAAFIGFARRGPVNTPVLITSWRQYVDTFGTYSDPHMSGAFLSHAIFGYFQNGGAQCYVTRLPPLTAGDDFDRPRGPVLAVPSADDDASPSFLVWARNPRASDIEVEIGPSEGESKDTAHSTFDLLVRAGSTEERFPRLSVVPGHAARGVVETLRNASQLILAGEASSVGNRSPRAPASGLYVIRGVQGGLALRQPQGVSDFIGDAGERGGIEALRLVAEANLVCAPDLMAAYQAGSLDRDMVRSVQLALISHCEMMGDRLAILDPLPDLSPAEVSKWRQMESAFDSRYAILYYPWLLVAAGEDRPILVPPCGHVAGVIARSDMVRGIHKAPAGGVVRGALSLAVDVTHFEQDFLHPNGINVLRHFPSAGIRIWGARTLSTDPSARFIQHRRLLLYIEESIRRATAWAVFEPFTDHSVWAQLRHDISTFLETLWRSGALNGGSPDEAYYVRCDDDLNPDDVLSRSQLHVEIGLRMHMAGLATLRVVYHS